MYYDVVVDEDYDKACQLYSALVDKNCDNLSHPHYNFLREAVTKNAIKCLKYGYRIFKDDDNKYTYVTFLERGESSNFIPLEEFLNMFEETVIL